MARPQYIIRVLLLAAAALVGVGVGPASSAARAASAEAVDAAIARGKKFIYGRMKGDNWEQSPKPRDDGQASVTGKQWGGLTAIAAYALLASGESPNEARLSKAIDWLKKAPISGHYAIGLRAQVWPHLPPREGKLASATDFRILLKSLLADRKRIGMYSYYTDLRTGQPQPGWWDHSVSQYGVLGMWACEQAGQEVPTLYWKVVDARWRKDQQRDGGWRYRDNSNVSGTMTAAGVATLFITQDYLLLNNRWSQCNGGKKDENIERGLAWMDKHAPDMLHGGNHYYYGLYGIERIGAASGRKYFGSTDWYAVGAEELVRRQKGDGSWGNFQDTCFSLLLLARGRAPVVMNKLEYDTHKTNAYPMAGKQEAPWNERPRDVANFAHWAGRQVEQLLHWQVVNLKVSPDTLHDAPILFVSGSEPLTFSDEEVKKLRQFVVDGGLILGNADCGSRLFARSFRELGGRLFPKYEFRELPDNHVIYTNQQFRGAKWRIKPEVEGLSNGTRELMLLIPSADPARAWQTRSEMTRAPLYQLVQDIYLYAVDKSNARYRGQTYIVHSNPKVKASRKARVVRLMVGDNPDPEPGGWPRLASILHNEQKVDVERTTAKLGEGKLKGSDLVHLTGTTTFILRPDQREELKRYVEDGGTLVIDAAGGSTDFADAAERELAAIFGPAAPNGGEILAPDHPLYTRKGATIDRVRYRDYARTRLSGRLSAPRLRAIRRGDRAAVFYSREDLSAGLVGQPVDGVIGYSPSSATEIMRNIVLYAIRGA